MDLVLRPIHAARRPEPVSLGGVRGNGGAPRVCLVCMIRPYLVLRWVMVVYIQYVPALVNFK